MQVKNQRNNKLMDISCVRNEQEGSHKHILSRPHSTAPKLSLDHTLNAFFDTTYLCDPARAK